MIIKQDFLCSPVGKNRPLHIYLPPEYDAPWAASARYPVMYFFDGQNLFYDGDATYGKCWGLKGFLDGWEKPLIIVGIECGHEGRERLNEYSPYYFNSGYIGRVDGIGDSILSWIETEVKPVIDARFRTWPHREATGIGGSSMGGLMSFYGVLKYNHVFSKAACLSPTVIPCYRKLCREIREAALHPDTRIWLSYGEEEAYYRSGRVPLSETKADRYLERILSLLADKGVMTRKYVQPGGGHSEAFWEKQLPAVMEYLWM